MLDLPRYLLGVAEILWLAGFAWLGASAVRSRLVPRFDGAPAHLVTSVLALALLIWMAELLGSFSLFEPVPYLAGVAVVGLALRLGLGGGRGCLSRLLGFSPAEIASVRGPNRGEKQDAAAQERHPRPPTQTIATVVAYAIAALALIRFSVDVKSKLATGMTGFDSTWYHGPFAAGFFQGGDTWGLHFIAPQFLAWFYPANAEIFHAVGMLAFGRDILSPLLNLGWFVSCLGACWCIGRPYRVAPWSLGLGAIALSLPVLSDQAGEARNDIVGIFFLLAAVAVALNAWEGRGGGEGSRSLSLGALGVAGLAAGLAAGTKLNFLLPAAVLVLGLPLLVLAGQRLRALAVTSIAALVGGGYWYLRNLIHTGNPLPWFDHLGPISLPAPEQALGGRESHTVLSYLTDGSVWSDWFLPGLHGGLTILWPLLLALALAGLLLCFAQRPVPHRPPRSRFEPHSGSPPDRGRDLGLVLVALTGLAAVLAWLIAPTSASGPDGVPRGFESGLRYLAPAIVLGLAALPAALLPWVAWRRGSPIAEDAGGVRAHGGGRRDRTRGPTTRAAGALILLVAIAIGYPVQRHYLENRYANPTFAAPGLNAAFKWANDISGARIATTSTRQYPLFGTDLSNHVQYVGEQRPHGGFVAPSSCRRWRELLDEGDYDYVVTTRDRIEPGKPPYPETAGWTKGVGAEVILRKPPTVIFKLRRPLDPSACPH